MQNITYCSFIWAIKAGNSKCMPKLDRLDYRLLHLLDRDSRQSFRALGRTLKVPPETVRYRINSLLQEGVIQNFLAVIDGGKLGFYYYKVLLRLHNVDETAVQKVIWELASQENVDWVVRMDGAFDVALTVAVSDPVQMSAFMDNLRAVNSERLARWALSINIHMHFFTRDYLTGAPRKPVRLGSYSASAPRCPMSERDWLVLRALAKTPRVSAEDIARETGLGADSVLDRVKRFERDNIVSRYSLVLNNAALGQLNYYVLIHLSSLSKERRQQFERFCQAQSFIVYLIKALGEWDYEISVECPNVQSFRDLMMEIASRFSDIVRNYEAMLVSKIHKYVYP